MRKLWPVAIAMLLTTGCVDAFLGPAPAQNHGALFDDVWSEFDLHYSFFAYNDINWDSLGTVYRPMAVAAATDQELGAAVGGMLAQLKDVHVSITPGTSASTIGYVSKWDTVPTFFNPAVVFSRYVQGARYTSGQHMRYGMATSTVGYVRIPTFAGTGWAPEIDEVLDSLPAAKSLIIDVRNNAGGDMTLAINVARRFADRKRTYAYVRVRNGPNHGDFTDDIAETVAPGGHQFGGPTYVLSNRRDFSSAEDFILAMRSFPGVTIVGDTTGGASGGPIVRELPNGWTYQLSEWMEYTPSHHMFERIGLAPDVVLKPTAADARDSVDVVLERACTLAGGG